MAEQQFDRLLTQQEVVNWTGMSPAFFEQARFRGTGPRVVKIGRSVRYLTSEIQRWIDDHTLGAGI